MDVLASLFSGFLIAFEPLNLLLIILGCVVGLFIGAMPGLGSVNGVAILLPVTFLVPPTSAIIFLGALYYGAMYGGAISSIMLGIPGASTAVATTFDGRPLALTREGRPGISGRGHRLVCRGYHLGGALYPIRPTPGRYGSRVRLTGRIRSRAPRLSPRLSALARTIFPKPFFPSVSDLC